MTFAVKNVLLKISLTFSGFTAEQLNHNFAVRLVFIGLFDKKHVVLDAPTLAEKVFLCYKYPF